MIHFSLLRKYSPDQEEGVSGLEYVVVAACIIVVSLGAISAIGHSSNTTATSISEGIASNGNENSDEYAGSNESGNGENSGTGGGGNGGPSSSSNMSDWINASALTIPTDASKNDAYTVLTATGSSNGSIYILSPDTSSKEGQVIVYAQGYYGWNCINKWLVREDETYTGCSPSKSGNVYAGDGYYRIDIPDYENGERIYLGSAWEGVSTITIEKTQSTRGAEALLDSYASPNGSIFIYAGNNPQSEQVIVSTRGQKTIWDESRWVMVGEDGTNPYDCAYGNGGKVYAGDIYYKIDLML